MTKLATTKVQKGDVLLVAMQNQLSTRQHNHMIDSFKKHLPGVKVMLLEECNGFTIIDKDAIGSSDDPGTVSDDDKDAVAPQGDGQKRRCETCKYDQTVSVRCFACAPSDGFPNWVSCDDTEEDDETYPECPECGLDAEPMHESLNMCEGCARALPYER